MNPDPNRRRLLLAGAAGLLAGPARAARLLEPTPAQTQLKSLSKNLLLIFKQNLL